ncbi:ATPase, T2SS/T4P/T4SS family [Gluconobacter sp. OJA]|uniref:type IV pilus twitching motility protein PilT n=1 Tax=Gluconobacter sp. OJA TaxID=3145197 RepID=UPI0031F75D0B
MSAVLKLRDTETWAHERAKREYPWVAEARKHAPGLDDFLKWAHGLGASRIDLLTGHRATLTVHGRNRYATMDPTTSLDLKQIVDHVYGADGSARVLISLQLDTAYSVTLNRRESLRFRINIFPVQTMRGPGKNLVFRPIPTLPPSLDKQRVEQEIRDTNLLRSGMVLTGGSTGSGKTTLQFGLIHERLMDPTVSCNISTGEQPIEFLFDSLKPPNGNRITQTEIRPPNLTPPLFVEGSMRRENSDLVLGECRDGPTMEAAINCAITGGKLSTTIHADNGPLMIQRAIALCPRAERDNLVSALAQSLRFVINQRLLERVGGGRVAVREFLTFHQDLRRQLMRTESELWPDLVAQAIESDGQSYAVAIRKALEEGVITEKTANDAWRRDA